MAHYFPPQPNDGDQLMADFSQDIDDPPLFANVEFLNLVEGQMFNKVQCRRGGFARQVLEDAVIQMKATFDRGYLVEIKGWVRRVGDDNCLIPLMKSQYEVMNLAENFTNPEHGAIPVPEFINGQLFQTLSFYVDLGAIYSDKREPVFKLARTDIAVRNRFQLVIELRFVDRDPAVFESKIFRCQTKKRGNSADGRRQTPSESGSSTSNVPISPNTPPSVTHTLITDSLVARTADIEDLVIGHSTTRNADIAYYLKFKDHQISSELDEGDVVGFFTDEDGQTYVKLLQSGDIKDAVHAGVVSKSYYLAANKMPEDESMTETVCVIGMVDVKVTGSVENGERVYASVDRPGKAVPQSHLPVGAFLRKKHVLLGMAMERKYPKSFEEEHLVKCFVCIVLDVGRQEILEEVEKVYEFNEQATETQIKFASRKTWRKLRFCFFVTAILFALLVFFLYQVFAPGTMFRYWLCERGRLSGDLWVNVLPYSSITDRVNVHGIRFKYEDVTGKVTEHYTRNDRTGHEDVYYFLNLDRCAYFGDQGVVNRWSKPGRTKRLGGGQVLSINYDCSIVYWFGIEKGQKAMGKTWWPYKSARNLTCIPNPPYEE